jgi:hypothetical protein
VAETSLIRGVSPIWNQSLLFEMNEIKIDTSVIICLVNSQNEEIIRAELGIE